jgi:hypothetical protein
LLHVVGGTSQVMMKVHFVVAVLVGLLGKWTPVVSDAKKNREGAGLLVLINDAFAYSSMFNIRQKQWYRLSFLYQSRCAGFRSEMRNPERFVKTRKRGKMEELRRRGNRVLCWSFMPTSRSFLARHRQRNGRHMPSNIRSVVSAAVAQSWSR